MIGDAQQAGSRAKLRSAAALIMVALLAAGCGGDDDAVSDATNAAEELVDEVGGADVEDAQAGAEAAGSDLAEALDDLGLTSLATAVEGLDLDELIDVGEYTFFAPSDEAFTSLSADGITDLLADPQLLVETLKNHLIEDRLDAASLAGMSEVTTRYGSTLPVESGDGISVGGAAVTTADVPVGEIGIIHVVDALLIPAN